MKNYTITEEQIKELAKENAKVKKWFPEVFETEIELNNWHYISKYDIVCFLEKQINCDFKGYGFDINNKYFDNREKNSLIFKKYITRKATDEEVFEALKNEAVKKYKVGDVVKCAYDGDINKINHLNFSYLRQYNSLVSNEGFEDSVSLFLDGNWAEIVPTLTKEEAEKKLNVKIID